MLYAVYKFLQHRRLQSNVHGFMSSNQQPTFLSYLFSFIPGVGNGKKPAVNSERDGGFFRPSYDYEAYDQLDEFELGGRATSWGEMEENADDILKW